MYGQRYWGNRYFGGGYWGHGILPVSIDVDTLRDSKHHVTFNLSVFKPTTLLAAQVNNGSIIRGARSIAYDTGTGSFSLIRSYQELWVGTTPGSYDVGRIRVKSITGTAASGTITVDENGIDWQDNHYLTIRHHYAPFKIDPRISGGVFKKFYDQNYTDENSQPPPVCIAGPHQVNTLPSGGSRTFNLDLSSSYAIAQGATISSYALSVAPSTGVVSSTRNASTGVGSVEVNQEGEWWATCSCTDSNGKTQERFVALKTDNSPYINSQLRSWSEAWGQGIRASVAAFGDVALSDFPDEALVILWYNHYFDDSLSYANIWESIGANVAFSGYIRKDTAQDNFTSNNAHEITFELSTIDTILDNIPLDSVTLETLTTPATWYQYARWLTVGRGIHHLLKWHSSIFELTDVLGLVNNTLFVKEIRFEKGTLRGMANTLSDSRGIHSQLTADRLGRLHLATDIQMFNAAQRGLLPTIFSITEDDLSGPVGTVRESEERAYTAQLSGFSFDGASSTPLVSLIPGYIESAVSYGIPGRRGSSNIDDPNQVLASQTDSNEKVGRRFANANRPIIEFRMPFRGSGYLGPLTAIPLGWYEMGIANTSLARGLGVNGLRLICRSISMQTNQAGGDAQISAVFEPEAIGPDGIQGNYPTGMPSPPNPAPPRWESPTPLTALVTWSESGFYYRDDNAADWTLADDGVYNGGTIDPWWRVKEQTLNPEKVIWWGVGESGLTVRTRHIDGYPVNLIAINNPPNTWGNTTPPTVSDLSVVHRDADLWLENHFYNLVRYQYAGGWQGWLQVTSNDGLTKVYVALYDGITLPDEVKPLWAAVNGSHLLVTVWAGDDTLRLLQFNPSTLAYVSEFALGACTSTELDDLDYIAYPATVIDDDDLWYVYGRMNAPQALANPEHIIKTANAGSSFSSFENGWSTDYCISLVVDPDDGAANRAHYAVRQTP